jgi:hypothetical protein
MRTRRRTSDLATAILVAVALTMTLLAAGCWYREAICRGGEYPVTAVGSTGAACAPDGEQPPAGYVRYPPGQEPRYVGDEWDRYWDTHLIDESGAVVSR